MFGPTSWLSPGPTVRRVKKRGSVDGLCDGFADRRPPPAGDRAPTMTCAAGTAPGAGTPATKSQRGDMETICGSAFDQDGANKDRKKFETCDRMAAAYDGWVKPRGHD
jgi:hypothetical protein